MRQMACHIAPTGSRWRRTGGDELGFTIKCRRVGRTLSTLAFSGTVLTALTDADGYQGFYIIFPRQVMGCALAMLAIT